MDIPTVRSKPRASPVIEKLRRPRLISDAHEAVHNGHICSTRNHYLDERRRLIIPYEVPPRKPLHRSLNGDGHLFSLGANPLAFYFFYESRKMDMRGMTSEFPASPTAALTILVAVLTLTAVSVRSWSAPRYKTLPGPRGWPIVGSALSLDKYPQRSLRRWHKQYGEIYTVQLFAFKWVFLNSPEAVKAILDKQSASTSDRINFPISTEAICKGLRLVLMPYGPLWRRLRSKVHQVLTPRMSNKFRPMQEFESKQALYDILTNNRNEELFREHIRRYVSSVMMTFIYGQRVPVPVSSCSSKPQLFSTNNMCLVNLQDCEEIREVYGVMSDFAETTVPYQYLADLLPFIAKLPTALHWWKGKARYYYDRQVDLWMKLWNQLSAKIAESRAPDCFVTKWQLTDKESSGITDLEGAFTAGSMSLPRSAHHSVPSRSSNNISLTIPSTYLAMIEAGSESTSSALYSCIKYLAMSPRVQERANEELTRVVGDQRSPSFDDIDQLPYIRAIAKEIVRLRPIAPVSPPHYTTADVIYKDYLIPKGSCISIGTYAIHYDESLHPDPESFSPERYLGHPLTAGEYAAAPDPYDRDHFTFGAGRRVCAGMYVAENSMFIILAKLLWAFRIRPCLGPDGKEEVLDTSDEGYVADSALTVSKPYRARFIPRNDLRKKTLVEEWRTAEREGCIVES